MRVMGGILDSFSDPLTGWIEEQKADALAHGTVVAKGAAVTVGDKAAGAIYAASKRLEGKVWIVALALVLAPALAVVVYRAVTPVTRG
jgi:hypothetical protein